MLDEAAQEQKEKERANAIQAKEQLQVAFLAQRCVNSYVATPLKQAFLTKEIEELMMVLKLQEVKVAGEPDNSKSLELHIKDLEQRLSQLVIQNVPSTDPEEKVMTKEETSNHFLAMGPLLIT